MEYKIIANPAAGRGKSATIVQQLEGMLRERKVKFDISLTKAPGDATDLARAAATEGWPVIISVGGDGTICEVVNGLVDTDSALGIISCGTGNDIARNLGVPTNVGQAIDTLLTGERRKIDVGIEKDQVFVDIAGIGFPCDVSRRANAMQKVKGPLAFFAATYKALSALKAIPVRIELDHDTMETNVISVTISNMKYAGGGMVFAPDAIVDDGLFDISIVGEMGKVSFALTFPQMYRDSGVKHPALSRHRSSVVRIFTEQPLEKMFDGNIKGRTPFEARILSKAVEILIPSPVTENG
jgi:diacylglycerol kinase (ATP)